MAIPAKPPRNRADIDAVISRGGSAPADAAPTEPPDRLQKVLLRIPASMLADVDKAVGRLPVPMPRNKWILTALVEKLQRERRRY